MFAASRGGKWDEIEGKPNTYPPSAHTHDYAATNHNHDAAYAAKSHTHNYAASNHNHDWSAITGKPALLDTSNLLSYANMGNAPELNITIGDTSGIRYGSIYEKTFTRIGNNNLALCTIKMNIDPTVEEDAYIKLFTINSPIKVLSIFEHLNKLKTISIYYNRSDLM